MLLAFLNTNGWNEGKWRSLIEEGRDYDVIGIGETGWHMIVLSGVKADGWS